ncbi:hypothetical protein CYMTET_20585 [Cymbomonas tetramitiformis]|uniref:Reverse transcriptase RNase H-like domain-containing protein n=1 Tax=Cymbomonas tetramitiformis TaxID=36881 RepID=A0AAE0G485_9CHLO|nr:hypothetical protein CYMTET_20585 [Cymbomonas tetramitiformis]
MADGQGRSEGGRAFTLTPTRPAANCESNSGTEALLAQQTALLNTMLQQMKDLNTRVEAALRQLPYGPHVAGNPFPTRPATLETDVPQMFNLNNDKTYGALSKLTHSSMLCEHLLVEHLGLEVDLKAGKFRVTPARLQNGNGGGCRPRGSQREAFASWCIWRLPPQSRWNGCKIWRSPTRAKVHIGSSLFAWGNVLRLKRAARGFWADELRHLHITHLELEGVYKTVQSFMRELTGKVVRLHCDNQAVVAMPGHFTSRNPKIMRRMRHLWILLDLYDWAVREWHRHTVDRFSSELSAQLPRYYAQWRDRGCEGVDFLAYSWLGEVNWVNPLWSLLDEVAHKLREESLGGSELLGASSWDGTMLRISASREKYEVVPAAVQQVSGWDAALQERWRGELGDSTLTDQCSADAEGSMTTGRRQRGLYAVVSQCG